MVKHLCFPKKNIDFHLCIYFHSYIISSFKKIVNELHVQQKDIYWGNCGIKCFVLLLFSNFIYGFENNQYHTLKNTEL